MNFLLPGQKLISTLLSDILTILGIIWVCKVFLDCFYNQIEKKQPSSRVEKIYAKTSFNIPSTDYYPRWSFEVNTNKGFFMHTNYMNNNVNFTTNIAWPPTVLQ